jgi:GT2 family glycosyltransferase
MDQPTAARPPTGQPSDEIADEVEPRSGVSIVACVLNEERHIAEAVARALDQDHPGPIELVIALGPSWDRTAQIVGQLAHADPRVRSIANPDLTGATPAGLNAAIAATRYPVVVRIDGHALLPRHYVRTAVETLRRTGADVVGGIMAAEGQSTFERAVARAMTSRLGVGSASFHTGGAEGPALTVYLGAFRRSALLRVGGYDESFLRAQDWEMNLRIRGSGGIVWFTPSMRVSYRPRSSVGGLARQYYHYGRWRRVVMRRNPGTASVRYLAPPVMLLAVLGGTAAALAGIVPALILPLGYLAGVTVGAAVEGRGLPLPVLARLPLVVVTMHVSWAVGFLTSPRRLAGGVREATETSLPTTAAGSR